MRTIPGNKQSRAEQSAAERREEGGGDDGWGEGWSWGEEVMFACVGAASELRVGLAAASKLRAAGAGQAGVCVRREGRQIIQQPNASDCCGDWQGSS
jgi:uncharacterized metal-binding protein